MQSCLDRVLARILLVLAMIAAVGKSNAQEKAAVPDEQAQQASQKAAGELYGGRFRQAKTTAEKTALATEILDAALKFKDGSADQYVLLKIARDMAAGAGDAVTALRTVEKTVDRFDVPGAKLTAGTLQEAARKARTSSQQKAVAEAVVSVVDSVADEGEYDLALSLCESARVPAQKSTQYSLAKELTTKIEDLKKRQRTSQEYRDAWAVLEENPTDPAANWAAGRHLCFVKGDWDRGVPMLALGSDAELKAAATKDLSGANSAEEQAALGDAWWTLAEGKTGLERDALRLRAGFWYRQAEPRLDGGLAKLKIKQRLDEVAKLGHEISVGSSVPIASRAPPPAIAPFDERTAKQHQVTWAKHLNLPVVQTNTIGMRFVLIPPGEFEMGSTAEEVARLLEEARTQKVEPWYIAGIPHEAPKHRVRITKPLYLGLCEVTQTEYERVMGSNPSKFKGNPNCPVEMVTWDEASAFCRKLGELPQKRTIRAAYRLPTEAEWEYACRAGTTTRFAFGDNAESLSMQAWWKRTAQGRTQPVGGLRPNAWGLYDMHGNVWEWCQDWHRGDYYGASPLEDPMGATAGSSRVIRGGDWTCHAGYCRSVARNASLPGTRVSGLGFRVASVVVDASGK